MLTENFVNKLREELGTITQYDGEKLITRSEWGTINFKRAHPDIDLVLSVARELSRLPLNYLTADIAKDIIRHIPAVAEQLKYIDRFSIEGGEPASNRDHLCANLHSRVEAFHRTVIPYIPYLAYRRGDIEERIKDLESAISSIKDTCGEAEKWVETKKEAIEETVNAAQEAAASVGVATFTSEFNKEYERLKGASVYWLGAAAIFGVATIAVAIVSFFWPSVSPEPNAWEILRNVVGKATIITVLFTSTVWCGRIYRAFIHQATINIHRALSLKTFRAFVTATDDAYVKDAVLMAATKAVFGNVTTGLVDQTRSGESAVNFVEFGKSSTTKGLVKGTSDQVASLG